MKDLAALRADLVGVYYPGYTFEVHLDGHRPYLQVSYREEDVENPGVFVLQKGRKWFLSRYMTRSEVVQTALKAVLTSAEHRVREHFLYRGRRVFGPHFDVDALWEIADGRNLDIRD